MIVYTISFTEKGDLLNKKFTDIFQNYSVYCSFKGQIKNGLKEWTKNAFSQADIIIFIGATGIVTRAIAPFITKKDVDPAVIVCDELANFVIPILSDTIVSHSGSVVPSYFTLINDVHPENASFPIDVTLFGIVTFINVLQSSNAFYSIDITLEGTT